MSQNLDLLRQKYCRPATFTGKRTRHLFPLEKECEDGKALLAKTATTLLRLKSSIHTASTSPIETNLPVRNCRSSLYSTSKGNHRIACEITTDLVPITTQSKDLPAHIPFKKTQAFVSKINDRRMKADRTLTQLAVILGIFPGIDLYLHPRLDDKSPKHRKKQ